MKAVLSAEGPVANMLEKCRSIVMKMDFPEGEKGERLAAELEAFGISKEDVTTKAWTAIKRVYASKFNERAYLATKKIGVTLDHIRMAVLIQKVVPAEYAFVVHTKNPTNNCADEIYVEAVRGLGETLVGSYAGQSFSCVINKSIQYDPKNCFCIETGNVHIQSLPNKSVGIRTAGGFMFRSDSNTEDLEGFAGAGLFDSFPSETAEKFRISYANVIDHRNHCCIGQVNKR